MSVFADAIGPRRPGGCYYDGYNDTTYRILAIVEGPACWRMTVEREADGVVRDHSTRWDADRDRVIR